MSAKVECTPIPLPVGSGTATLQQPGSIVDVSCYPGQLCIEAAGNFSSVDVEIQTSLTGEFWQPALTINGPGLYPFHACAKYLRAATPNTGILPADFRVRLTLGGVVHDDCCDPCACKD